MKKSKAFLVNFLLFTVSLTITFGAAEFIFRKLIFGSSGAFKNLRNPGFYADYLNEDNYWKLYYMFGGESKPPENPHPLLGWVGNFNRNTLLHNETPNTLGKRPVLLYGDSYAQCMPEVSCFEDFLNAKPGFSDSHYFVNYGVGGYGVDQIQILFDSTVHYYRDPFVVFSLMVYDLDRTPMSFRTGQKPVYNLSGNTLKLSGVPIDPDPANFIEHNPPDISSYLYRRFLYSDANVLSENMNRKLKHWDEVTEYKIALNSAILKQVVQRLRNDRIDFVFLIFHYLKPGDEEFKVENDNNWRDEFLRKFLADNSIPFIWSKDIIRNDPAYTGKNYDKYMLLDNGHPTTYFNGLIAEEIHSRLRQNENIRNNKVDSIISLITQSEEWFSNVKEKASKASVPIEIALKSDAQFLIDEMIADKKVFPGAGYFERKIKSDSVWFHSVSDKASVNGNSLQMQLSEDANFIYNLEIEKNRHKNPKAEVYDKQIKYLIDSLHGTNSEVLKRKYNINETRIAEDILYYKAALEAYNEKFKGKKWY